MLPVVIGKVIGGRVHFVLLLAPLPSLPQGSLASTQLSLAGIERDDRNVSSERQSRDGGCRWRHKHMHFMTVLLPQQDLYTRPLCRTTHITPNFTFECILRTGDRVLVTSARSSKLTVLLAPLLQGNTKVWRHKREQTLGKARCLLEMWF